MKKSDFMIVVKDFKYVDVSGLTQLLEVVRKLREAYSQVILISDF